MARLCLRKLTPTVSLDKRSRTQNAKQIQMGEVLVSKSIKEPAPIWAGFTFILLPMKLLMYLA